MYNLYLKVFFILFYNVFLKTFLMVLEKLFIYLHLSTKKMHSL